MPAPVVARAPSCVGEDLRAVKELCEWRAEDLRDDALLGIDHDGARAQARDRRAGGLVQPRAHRAELPAGAQRRRLLRGRDRARGPRAALRPGSADWETARASRPWSAPAVLPGRR